MFTLSAGFPPSTKSGIESQMSAASRRESRALDPSTVTVCTQSLPENDNVILHKPSAQAIEFYYNIRLYLRLLPWNKNTGITVSKCSLYVNFVYPNNEANFATDIFFRAECLTAIPPINDLSIYKKCPISM